MAVGDKAAAHGYAVVPQTALVSNTHTVVNQVSDNLADEVDARAAADTALRARTPKINISNTPMTSTTAAVGDLRFYWS